MDVREKPPHAGVHLRPEELDDVEHLVLLLAALRAAQVDPDLGKGIRPGHPLPNLVQVAVGPRRGPGRPQPAALGEPHGRGMGIGLPDHAGEVLGARHPKHLAVNVDRFALAARVIPALSRHGAAVERHLEPLPAARAGHQSAKARPEARAVQPDQGLVAPADGPRRKAFEGVLWERGAEGQQGPVKRMPTTPAFPKVKEIGIGEDPHQVVTLLRVGSAGSVTLVSRSQPSFSSLMCSIAIAFAFASRSGRAWYSETQHRKIL